MRATNATHLDNDLSTPLDVHDGQLANGQHTGNNAFHMPTLMSELSLHVHLVRFDELGTDGTSVGWNYVQAPMVGQTYSYRWFVDVPLRTVYFHDHQNPNTHQQHGLWAAMNVEPKDSVWTSPTTGAPLAPAFGPTEVREEARALLDAAVALTRAVGGRLDVMRAFWSAPASVAGAADLEARARAGLGEAVQALPADVDAHARVFLGSPERALVAHTGELDLLVVGSRGKGPLAAAWAGSVSSRVIREARCPVLVVERGATFGLAEPLEDPAATQPA